jgi:predicted PhzF superfamily epimerase YddE/YHI9
MALTIYHVDAFTDSVFGGNPAGVCILPEPREDVWMQKLAQELNLSETAFLQKRGDGYNLRWFTPLVEVDLCGHATLASAHILWEQGLLTLDKAARFHTRSGLLTAERRGDWIELDFPSLPDRKVPIPRGMLRALGVRPRYVGRSRFDYIVEVETENAVRKIKPNFTLLSALPIRGLIVTARASTAPYDFVSRFFAPRAGINEDPVTGSSHSVLGPFWKNRLGKSELFAYQASKRGGVLRVRVGNRRVFIGGKAVTVFQAELDAQNLHPQAGPSDPVDIGAKH